MPLPEIVSELQKMTKGKVFQADMPKGTKLPSNVEATPLYVEVTF
jgi:hypothetical protein